MKVNVLGQPGTIKQHGDTHSVVTVNGKDRTIANGLMNIERVNGQGRKVQLRVPKGNETVESNEPIDDGIDPFDEVQ